MFFLHFPIGVKTCFICEENGEMGKYGKLAAYSVSSNTEHLAVQATCCIQGQ